MNAKRVVVAPLDWGLGHATRCIPIIETLQKKSCEVFIASSGSALALLRKELPGLKYFELAPYNVRYSKRTPIILSILFQIPKILKTIAREKAQLEKIIDEHKIDLVISDNRYGCRSEKIPSIFIGHQLNIQLPGGLKWLKTLVNYFHHRSIRKFTQCWIPDQPGELNLTGKLSNRLSFPAQYIGILSRFRKTNAELKYDLAVILSGPEPQRTILEEIIRKQIHKQNLKVVLVRGVIENETSWKQEGNVSVVNYLQSNELADILNQSKLIIARSGYSTIMDLAKLGKKAIFIPTHGQTEQEYLAMRLIHNGICYSVNQQNFDLASALTAADNFSGFSNIEVENGLLSKALDEVLK